MEASANVTREEFNTAIEDISAKMDALMTTMSQLVQGAAPTAGDGRESRGGRHTAPGSDQGGLDRAPNTREAPSWQRHRAASSVGNASRESAHVLDPKTATFKPKVAGNGGNPEGLKDEGGALKSRGRG